MGWREREDIRLVEEKTVGGEAGTETGTEMKECTRNIKRNRNK